MKRLRGAPPVALCIVSAVILVLHLALILYIRHQIPRLEARIRKAELRLVMNRNYEEDGIPDRYQPSGALSTDVGLLAEFRDLNRSLPHYLWLTGCIFLLSLAWRKDPETE